MNKNQIVNLERILQTKYGPGYINSAIKHFDLMTKEFQIRNWEQTMVKGGKFLEAVLKSLYRCIGKTPSSGRKFKVDAAIKEIENSPTIICEDSLRILLPRACRFCYDVVSNRGARHDPEEVNPNEMDATAVLCNCSWILSEMIRVAAKGKITIDQARLWVEELTEKKLPIIEEEDGRLYFHAKEKSASDVAVVVLWKRYPNRVNRERLLEMLVGNGFSKANSFVALTRLKSYVDDDGSGNLKLLAPGRMRAERLVFLTSN